MPNKITPCRGATKWMHIHTKKSAFFSKTPPVSPQEFKNFLSPNIINLSDSKELFLICFLLFSLKLCRPTPIPPAIIILTSLCFPGLIASRIQLFSVEEQASLSRKSLQLETRRKKNESKNIFQVQFTNTYTGEYQHQEQTSWALFERLSLSIQLMYSLRKLPPKTLHWLEGC